jgi:hypothetical protein
MGHEKIMLVEGKLGVKLARSSRCWEKDMWEPATASAKEEGPSRNTAYPIIPSQPTLIDFRCLPFSFSRTFVGALKNVNTTSFNCSSSASSV